MTRTIGILGGMGPEATLNLFDQVIRLTQADTDQENVPVLIWNNPSIPDRTSAILHGGPSPLPKLIEGARILEKGGADMILMPCVTAHYFYHEIIKHISIPFLHLLDTARLYIEEHLPAARRLGVIATKGTFGSNLFHDIFIRDGKELVIPDDRHMQLFMDAVYSEEGLKVGYKEKPKQKLLQIVHHLAERGADAIIGGCSEIPLVLSSRDMTLPFIDPLKLLAAEGIKRAGFPVSCELN